VEGIEDNVNRLQLSGLLVGSSIPVLNKDHDLYFTFKVFRYSNCFWSGQPRHGYQSLLTGFYLLQKNFSLIILHDFEGGVKSQRGEWRFYARPFPQRFGEGPYNMVRWPAHASEKNRPKYLVVLSATKQSLLSLS
jgi:hypothetical protein